MAKIPLTQVTDLCGSKNCNLNPVLRVFYFIFNKKLIIFVLLILKYIMCIFHKYDLISTTVHESQAEILMKNGFKPNTHTSFEKKFVYVFVCRKRKCGKVKIKTKFV